MQTVHPKAVLGITESMDLLTPACGSASILPLVPCLAKAGTAMCRWAGVVSLPSSGLTAIRRDFQLLFLPGRLGLEQGKAFNV